MKTITTACVNHKGGVAKTTSLLNPAAGIARMHKKRVCIIDADPQAEYDNGSVRGRNGKSSPGGSARECATGLYAGRSAGVKAAKVAGEGGHTAGLPGSGGYGSDHVHHTGREFLFREIVKGLEEKYDHILIDCPPSLGIITQNALMASDYVIIPTDGNYFAMKGIEKIHYIIGLLKRKLGADVRILGYFMTKYNAGEKAGCGYQGESGKKSGRWRL
ncbi:AAA family ATPase [Bacteroides fragilis]|nr:AAA family ATPase [Bacteroides fragilis]